MKAFPLGKAFLVGSILMALNGIEWQSLPLVAEWHLMTKIIKSRPAIKQSQTALAIVCH